MEIDPRRQSLTSAAPAGSLFQMLTTFLALLLAGGDARFEAAGVRIGDLLVSGDVLELRTGALVSGRVLEALAAPLRVEAGDGLVLVLEPGVRAAREAGGIRLSAHAPARLRVAEAVGENVLVERTADGWAVAGRALAGDVRVSLQGQQDDPDALLRRGEPAAQKMRESSQRVRPPALRRVFPGGSPFVGGQAADSHAIRQLAQLSLSGS